MILLLDIGNTNTHVGLAHGDRIIRQADIPTKSTESGVAARLKKFVGARPIKGAALCSVVPAATKPSCEIVSALFGVSPLILSQATMRLVGIDYPRPATIGPDRLANAIAAKHFFGAPAVVVDFGTAVTFDVVDNYGNYVGGIIAPGLASMTDYLHERTALLPRIRIFEVKRAVGKSTKEAMRIGAVHGYRGLIRELLAELRAELKAPHLPVIATGGYSRLISSKLPEISAVNPLLTLEGLRLLWEEHAREQQCPQ